MPALTGYSSQPVAPPPVQKPPPEQMVMDGTPLGVAPAPPPAQMDATPLGAAPASAPPVESTAPQPAQLPPATPRVTSQGPTALEQVPVIGPPLQALGNIFRGGDPEPFRPADAGVQGLGPEFYGEQIQAADKGLQQASGPVETLGAVKDVGLAHLQEHKGEVSPIAARNKREMARLGYALATTGEPPPDMNPAYVASYANDPFVKAFQGPDQDNLIRSVNEGYTRADGTVYAPGDEAAWEYFADGLTNPQNIITDIVADPVSVVADVASMGIGGVGRRAATRGAEMTARGLGSGTALQVAGRTAEGVATGIDAVATGGLSLAVPGVFKGAGKVLSATPLGKPTARALAEETEATTAELGGALLGERRVAGPVGSEMSAISNPVRGDRAITQVSLPAEGTTPASTFAYRNDPRGVMVYDDPGTFRTMRRPTEADLGTVQELLGRVGQRDRQVLRDPWWDWAMRNRDAAGDDLVDPLWPELPARGALPSVSTGRNRAAAQRHVDDLVSAMRRFDDPDGNRPVLYELLNDWRGTNFDNQLHPLTRRPMAEHRLETVKQVLNALPEHNNLYAKRQIALMERQLPRTPGTIGTGMIWQAGKKAAAAGDGAATKTGTLVSYTPAHAERMSKLATIPSKEFFKGKAFAKADFTSGLIARSAGASPKATNAYENWQGLLAARMNNPVLRRGDVGAMRDRFRGSVGGPVSVTAQKELDGLKDALDRTGIIPGATTMDSASIEIALSRWLKANPSFRVEMPAGGAIIGPGGARPLGVYDPGSADEVLNMALPPDIRAKMEETYDIGGTTYRVVDRLIDWQIRGEDMRALARNVDAGVRLNATQQRALDSFVAQVRKMHGEYSTLTRSELATFTDAQMDRIASASVGAEQGIAAGIRSSTGALKPRTTNPLLKTYDNITGMIRSTILYSPFRGVAYPLMQGMGNAFSNLIAAPGALRYYTPLDYRKVIRQIKDPEAAAALMPTALRIRDAIGLGRTGNLGRVSRDQMGGYTWFNDPSAGAFRRGAGKLLAPQWIKDTADSFDTLHRQSLWRSVFEPAYVRLKSDMPKMAITAFDEARRRTGLTLPVSADDLTDALKRLDLDNGGYYSAAQVREAIYAAAGGRSAPNSQEVYNVADRIHRLYREEVGRLDEAAQREVDRVAFNGGETNLDAFLQRTLMFSWWNTRAARLYLTELAKSPIQMALFARAVEAGNRNEQGGASPGYKDFTAFMQTPAGYTMMLNPFTLSSTVGTFASMEPVSEKAQLTALGEITEGGFLGNNLMLNPIIKGALGFIGALGADYRQPDMTGISRMEREFNDAAEYVNFHVSQFYATRDGNPRAVPNLDLNSFQNVLAQKLSGYLPGTQEVVERDPNIGQESAVTIYVRDHLLELNPELGIPDADGKLYDLEHAVRDAMANPDSESYQVGLNKYVDSLYQGPGTDKGGALALIGAIARDNLPFQMNGMPTSRLDAKMRQNRDAIREGTGSAFLTAGTETTALDKQLGWLPYETAENRELELAQSDFFGAGDPATKEALAMAKEIKAGTTDVDVAGMSFSPDELAMLSQKDRNAVSSFWLNATGYGDAYEQREAAQDAALAADPRLADSLGWKEWVAQYPGGPMRALEDTALVNPNVRRVTESQEWKDVVANGTPEDIEDAIGFMGPLVAGVKESRFGHAVDETYRGVVGGMEGTVGQWYLQQRADGGEASFSSEKAAAVEADLAGYQETVAALNAFDPSGASAAEYQANIMAGSSRPIPYAAYQAGIKGFTASDGEWFGQYLAWGMSEPQGMDTSPARWADEDSKSYYSRRTIEIRTALDNGAYVPVEPVVEGEEVVTGLPDSGRPAFYPRVTAIEGSQLYTAPNGRTLGPVSSSAVLSVVEVGNDPNGKRWALVTLPDGKQAYVPTAVLQKAA